MAEPLDLSHLFLHSMGDDYNNDHQKHGYAAPAHDGLYGINKSSEIDIIRTQGPQDKAGKVSKVMLCT